MRNENKRGSKTIMMVITVLVSILLGVGIGFGITSNVDGLDYSEMEQKYTTEINELENANAELSSELKKVEKDYKELTSELTKMYEGEDDYELEWNDNGTGYSYKFEDGVIFDDVFKTKSTTTSIKMK